MVAKKDTDSKKKINKKALTKKGVTAAKKGGAAAAWGAFTTATIYTIILMWILFPFYSWQLQIIFDQAKCMDPKGKGCTLPYNKMEPPYCPGPDAGGCRETVNGPDSLTAVFEFFTQTLQQIYEIITGIAWIKVDEAVTKMEKKVKAGPKQPATGEHRTKTTGAKMVGGGVHSDSRKGIIKNTLHHTGYGQAVDIAEKVLNSSVGFDSKTAQSSKCCDDVLEWDNLKTQAECSESFSLFNVEPFKSILPKDFGWPYTYLFNAPKINPEDGKPFMKGGKEVFTDTRYDPNGTPAESAPSRWVGAWFAKTQERSWSASRGIWSRILMLFFPFLHEDLTNVEVELRIQNFIDALDKEYKKLNVAEKGKKGTSEAGSTGAASGETGTQQGGAIFGMGKKGATKKEKCKDQCLKDMEKMIETFKDLFKKFKDKFPYQKDGAPKGGKVNVRGKLYKTMNDMGLFKKGQRDAARAEGDGNAWEYGSTDPGHSSAPEAGKTETKVSGHTLSGGAKTKDSYGIEHNHSAAKTARGRKTSTVDNIYLDFFLAASKPPEHTRTKSGTEKKSHWARFLNPFGGDTRYWMRYLITWYMPILTMILITVAIFTGFWFTAFSSINRYSNFILPIAGGIWIAFANMFAQPTSALLYMLFGASGKHRNSAECPYDSGVFQMRRNMKQYFGLNAFITVAVIVTHLGFALAASGQKVLGGILSMLFPIYILIILVIKLFHWIWYLA